MYIVDRMGNRERISLKNAKKEIKRLGKGKKIRITTNPYNLRVMFDVRVDFIDYRFDPPNFETIWLEGLTEKTEKEIISMADEEFFLIPIKVKGGGRNNEKIYK
jgi:hypothetical protein